MVRINWGRLALGTVVAAIIMFLTDGLIHESIVGADWRAVYAGLQAAQPSPHGSSMVYFGFYELGRAFTAMLFYVTMRAFFGAGPKTAVLAGIVGWIAFSLTGPAQFPARIFLDGALAEGWRAPPVDFDTRNHRRRRHV